MVTLTTLSDSWLGSDSQPSETTPTDMLPCSVNSVREENFYLALSCNTKHVSEPVALIQRLKKSIEIWGNNYGRLFHPNIQFIQKEAGTSCKK